MFHSAKVTICVFFVAVFLSIEFDSYAQNKRNNNWYFGRYAGLTFNTIDGNPAALVNGVLTTEEGCASISDTSGRLIMYTDGTKIWDRSHQVMPNSLGLLGDISSTQSALIIPVIGQPNKYYVFTVDGNSTENTVGPQGSWDGLYYSIVDMDLPGNGTFVKPKGDIDTLNKNIQLVDSVDEKLTAAMHANGKDYWIITKKYSKNAYYAFLVTSCGVDIHPVISYAGDSNTIGATGYMKASYDGKALVNVEFNEKAYLFDFDNSTGIITNNRELTQNYFFGYGLAFSPNDSLIYISVSLASWPIKRIYQFERYGTGQNYFDLTVDGAPLGLQTAPDGKIYCAMGVQNSNMTVISTPNIFGDPGIIEDAISLNGKYSTLGLPNIFDGYIETPIREIDSPIQSSMSICKGESILLTNLFNDTANYFWKLSDKIFVNEYNTNLIQPIETTEFYAATNLICTYADTIILYKQHIDVVECGEIFVPNSFTPNNDGENDFFGIQKDFNTKQISLKVYDVYGKIVFDSFNKNEQWDGNYNNVPAAIGTYAYSLEILYTDDNRLGFQQKGNVMLLR